MSLEDAINIVEEEILDRTEMPDDLVQALEMVIAAAWKDV